MNLWTLLAAVLLVLLILAFVMILQSRYRPEPETEVVVYEDDWPWWYDTWPGWYGITVAGVGAGWGPHWQGYRKDHHPWGSRPGGHIRPGGHSLGGGRHH